jgi:hypothetical protein
MHMSKAHVLLILANHMRHVHVIVCGIYLNPKP